MDPVKIGAVILAIVGGTAGEASSRLWDELTALVCQPLHRRPNTVEAVAAASGNEELAALQQSPADQRRAVDLAEVLLVRVEADPAFGLEFRNWWAQASQVLPAMGNVTNTISGGTQHGPVLQGRDFSNITFGSSSTAPKVPPS